MDNSDEFVVTMEWLINNKTPAGGYTRIQMEVFGNYPPKSGWLKKAVGTTITKKQKIQFEEGAFVKRKDRKEYKKTIKKLEFLENILEKEIQIKKLREEIKKLRS